MPERICSMTGCEEPHLARGWCAMHYRRWWKHGDPGSAGKLRRYGTIAERFWPQVLKGERCWPWQGRIRPDGYGAFDVPSGGRMRPQLAHRVAWMLAVGPIPPGVKILHRCDNPPCCNYERCLFLGTQADNVADMMNKGRGRGQFTSEC